MLYYMMDLHYLLDELAMNGVIKEPNAPRNTVNLAGLTLCGSCAAVFCAGPLIVIGEIIVIIDIVWRFIERCLAIQRRNYVEKEKERRLNQHQQHRHGLCYRIYKTLRKRCCFLCCQGGSGSVRALETKVGSDEIHDQGGGSEDSNDRLNKEREETEKRIEKEIIDQQRKDRELQEKKRREDDEKIKAIQKEIEIEKQQEVEIAKRRVEEEMARRQKELEAIEEERKKRMEKKEAERKAREEEKAEKDKHKKRRQV